MDMKSAKNGKMSDAEYLMNREIIEKASRNMNNQS
jgi:hypothetical protein